MGITSAGIQHAHLVISRFNLFYFSAGNSIPPSYIYIYIYIPSRIQVHGFHLKPLSESSCARQRDRLRREFVFAQCFRFIIDESLPAFPPLIPRNVLKQVLIKSREEFIYIYIYLSSSPPLYNSRFSATCYCAHAFYCLSNYALTDRWRVRREDGVNFVGRRGVRNGVYRSSARGDERKYHSRFRNELIRPRVLVPRHQISLKFL